MSTSVFNPRFVEEPGEGTSYEDGCVTGAVDEYVANGRRILCISEWSSYDTGKGHTKRALVWLRSQGFAEIVANDVGVIEDGVGDIATACWQHMHELGLVDVLLDDYDVDITHLKTTGNPSFNM